MLSVFIVTGLEVLTSVVLHSYEHCKGISDTSELAIWWKLIHKLVTSACNKFYVALLCVLYFTLRDSCIEMYFKHVIC